MRSSAILALAALALWGRSGVGAGSEQGQTPGGQIPRTGLVITASTRLQPGTYRLTAADDKPAIVIRGNGITVDLTGVTIEGGIPDADPDTYTGIGIQVEDAADVVIRGGTVRGYKVGLLARRTPRLRIEANDFSHNWKARLWSGIEKESLVDWMSYHDNEKDQWLRYGAAIYLSECDGCVVDGNVVVQGQNALMATRSSRLTITNNTFSWNSAIGLGLYRTTDSVIQHNRIDWDVRGYSHGFYNRGQDSSAILMYEQSSRNVIAYNSATHGGDGLFLWAGQSTMDTGQGGANDNLFYGNDFSHAVANGIEATFSRNRIVRNRIDDSWHGIWGGYSH
ncbi:MAG TPA: NosD domain-containing protein, partial [Vicinamibacterales bacterium]|nr:NosD domain-containing protein [Vicinamibacterales bacterium]